MTFLIVIVLSILVLPTVDADTEHEFEPKELVIRLEQAHELARAQDPGWREASFRMDAAAARKMSLAGLFFQTYHYSEVGRKMMFDTTERSVLCSQIKVTRVKDMGFRRSRHCSICGVFENINAKEH